MVARLQIFPYITALPTWFLASIYVPLFQELRKTNLTSIIEINILSDNWDWFRSDLSEAGRR